ncbi:MAG: septal ring lytic transglycosylase RlpA family protein [Deltaproteobacteria bacterium]|nr:septal ring lytic transglycosylase RlpA family protein [Deltaproteobacteria bacterium]
MLIAVDLSPYYNLVPMVVVDWRSRATFLWTLSLSLTLFVGGCSYIGGSSSSPAGSRRTTPDLSAIAPDIAPGTIQTGLASWYGPGFHGKRTANGEIYNQHDLTAAHPSLPLGTRVMVTNVNTNQAIEVRVNDRGPYIEGRAIDLSYAAARTIGVYEPGVAPVRIEVLSPAAAVLAVAYAVQLGSYADASQASALKARMAARYPDVYISPMNTGLKRYYLVRLGPFSRRADALSRAEDAARTGMRVIVVEEDDRWAEG